MVAYDSLICDQNPDVRNDNNDCESKSHLFVKIFFDENDDSLIESLSKDT